MTLRRYGNEVQSIEKAKNSLDVNAMVLCGAFVKSINMNIGWGNTGSTCDVTLVPDYDYNTGHTTYKEPHVGSAIRIAIPNDTPILPSHSLFDSNNPYSNLSFTGIVTSVDFNIDSSGKTVSIRLSDGKEILNNIPVLMRKQDSYNKDKMSVINNHVYAYPSNETDENDIAYVNNKGLMIKAIRDALVFVDECGKPTGKVKEFTFFANNDFGNPDLSPIQTYSVDMSRMFDKRIGKPFAGSNNFAEWDEEDPFNMYSDGGFDEDFTPEDNDYICSPKFRVDGEFKSLGDIINQAMEKNGCDWFVYCDEDSGGNLTGKISSVLTIRIIPVPRNDFDQLTCDEMDLFLQEFDGLISSSSFGNELQNNVSNKAFYGQHIEKLEETPTSELKQFWGFKRPEYGVEPISEVTDRYGQKIAVRGAINKNPTFDFGAIPAFAIGEEIVKAVTLRCLLKYGYGLNGTDAMSKIELFDYLEELSTVPTELEINLGDPLIAQSFFCLARSTAHIDTFRELMKSLIEFVAHWDRFGDNTFSISGEITDLEVDVGDVINSQDDGSSLYVDPNIEGDIGARFVYTKLDDENTVTSKATIYLHDGSITTQAGEIDADEIIFRNLILNKDGDDLSKPRFTVGLHVISITVFEYDKNSIVVGTGFIWMFINHFDENNNPYEVMRESSIYKLAKFSMSIFNDTERLTTISNKMNKMSKKDKTNQIEYSEYFSRMVAEREIAIFNVIKNYIAAYYNKKFYIDINEGAQWDVISEAWDGFSGSVITHPSVRGKFLNRETGKIPCIFNIKDIEGLDSKNNSDNSVFIFDDHETGTGNISYWGKASAEIFITNPEDDDGKVDGLTMLDEYLKTGKILEKEEGELEPTSYLVVTAESQPKLQTIKYGIKAEATPEDVGDMYKLDHGILSIDAINRLSAWKAFSEKVRKSDTGAENFTQIMMLFGDLPKIPDLFYVPVAHRNVRYGPWILDRTNDRNNRSNFGKTEVVIDEMLTPWTFKEETAAFQYLLDQHQYDLASEHKMNRGRVTVSDIPRFNIGQKVGSFSNISSISVNYDSGGVTTTYTLSAFGAGKIVKEQRERQKIIRKVSNLEDIVADLQNSIKMQQLQSKFKDGPFGEK